MLRRCIVCGKVINAGRTFCSMACFGDATFRSMVDNKKRKEYMVSYEIRQEEINNNIHML